ncbi:MAG: hypothetical protein Q8L90_18475 [Bacteroidota bacterium]|nr:hypothetical protein [Bacteroidota bacterium]
MKKTLISGMFALTVLLFGACSKPKDGAPGAQGPQGNANVQSSTFTVTSWGYTAPYYYVDLPVSSITQDIINTGAVLVYLKDGSANVQLPYTWYPNANYSETLTPLITLGNVRILVEDSDQTQPDNPGAGDQFKVVVMASKSMLRNPHIDFKNFASVEKAFNLKD